MSFPDLLKDILKLPYYPSDEYIDMLRSVHTAAWDLECSSRTEESKYLLDFIQKDWDEWKEDYAYILEEQKAVDKFSGWSKEQLAREILHLREILICYKEKQ